MGIETTKTIKRANATNMLAEKGVRVHPTENLELFEDLLYDNRESIFENYKVVEDDYALDKNERFKEYW